MATYTVQAGTSLVAKKTAGDATITLNALANNYSRKATVLDFGASWGAQCVCQPYIDLAVAPTAGNVVEVYCAFKVDGTNYEAGISSADADWQTSLADNNEWKKLVTLCGVFPLTADSGVQIPRSSLFLPRARYGIPILINFSGQALASNDNSLITFVPLEGVST